MSIRDIEELRATVAGLRAQLNAALNVADRFRYALAALTNCAVTSDAWVTARNLIESTKDVQAPTTPPRPVDRARLRAACEFSHWDGPTTEYLSTAIPDLVAEIEDKESQLAAPIPMTLWCPECRARHVDLADAPPHKVHACQACGWNWRQANVPTVSVQFLPDCTNPLSAVDAAMAAEGFHRIGRIDSVERRSLWLREDEHSFTLRAGREGRDANVTVTDEHPLYAEIYEAVASGRFAAEFEHPFGAELAGYRGIRPMDIEEGLLPASAPHDGSFTPSVAQHDTCLTPLDDEAHCSKCGVEVPSNRIVRRPLRWRLAVGDVIVLLIQGWIRVITKVRNTGYTWEYLDRSNGGHDRTYFITENSDDPWFEHLPWILALRGARRPV